MRIRLATPSRAGLRRRSRFVGTKPVTFGFPTTIAGDGRTILDQFGVPWYAIGDSAWAAVTRLSLTDMDTYLDDRQSRGFKAVVVEAPEHYSTSVDVDGNYPWTGTAFQSTLNEPYWDRHDAFLAKAAARGITVIMSVTYLGFTGTDEGWDDEMAAATNAQCTTHGGYLAARYKNRPNLMWLAGGDTNSDATHKDRVDHVMAAIRSGGANQLILTHQVRGTSGYTVWGTYGWFQINTDYADGTSPTVSTETTYALTTAPVIGIEYAYEYSGGTSDSGQLQRGNLWSNMTEHAVVSFFGNNPIWGFDSAYMTAHGPAPYLTWQTSLNSPGSLWASLCAQFIASYTPANWKLLVPGVALVTTGEGTTTAKAGIGVDVTNGRAVAYFPSSRSITLDLSVFTPSSLTLRWFDPTNAAYTTVGTYPNTAGRAVTYPGSANGGGDGDWVLVVTPGAAVTTAPSPAVNRRHRLLRHGRM